MVNDVDNLKYSWQHWKELKEAYKELQEKYKTLEESLSQKQKVLDDLSKYMDIDEFIKTGEFDNSDCYDIEAIIPIPDFAR